MAGGEQTQANYSRERQKGETRLHKAGKTPLTYKTSINRELVTDTLKWAELFPLVQAVSH